MKAMQELLIRLSSIKALFDVLKQTANMGVSKKIGNLLSGNYKTHCFRMVEKREWQNVASAEKVHLFPDRLRSRLVRGCLPLKPGNDIFVKYDNKELFKMLMCYHLHRKDGRPFYACCPASVIHIYFYLNRKLYSFSSLASVSKKIRIFSTLAGFYP